MKAIDDAVQRDRDQLTFVQAQRDAGTTAARKVELTLDSFAERLEVLETAIRPLHRETTLLTRARDNIRGVLDLLEDVEEFYDTSGPLARVIRSGPHAGTSGLDEYLDAMRRIARATAYFEARDDDSTKNAAAAAAAVGDNADSKTADKTSSGASSSELASLRELEADGLRELEEELLRKLQEHASAPDAVELATRDRDDSHVLPDNVATDCRNIAVFLAEVQGMNGLCNAYARARVGVVEAALSELAEAAIEGGGDGTISGMSEGSGGSILSTTATPRGNKSGRVHTPARRLSKNVLNVGSKLTRTVSKRVARRDTTSSAGAIGAPVMEPANRLGSYRPGTHLLLQYARATVRYMQREAALAKQVLPKAYLPTALAVLYAPLATALINMMNAQVVACRASLAAGRFFTCVYIFDVADAFVSLWPDWSALLRFTTGGGRGGGGGAGESQELLMRDSVAALATVVDVARAVLQTFQDMVNGEAGKKRPEDGTVHELTGNTLGLLSELAKYMSAVGRVLGQGGAEALSGSADQAHGATAVASWILAVLKALTGNLRRKARGYEAHEEPLGCVFLLNNYDYIWRTILGSPFAAVLKSASVDLDGFFGRLMDDQRAQYMQTSWSAAQAYLVVEDVSDPLSKREREVIKERYLGFNAEWDRQRVAQAAYTVPNARLRRQLRTESSALLVPLFRTFDVAYRQSGFSSKNPHKYLKYTPDEVTSGFAEFFGGEP